MQLKIFSTLSRQIEEFEPLPNKDFIGIYSCGPTVYSTPHIGNLRASWTADLIRNTLKIAGYKVKAVMNITDVGHLVSDEDEGEDKMEKGSKKEGLTSWDVAKKYEGVFREGLKALNIEEFDAMPRATEHIVEQINIVNTLDTKGLTYPIEDGIYFDTSKLSDYGKLIGPEYKKHLEGIRSGARVEAIDGKRNPTDFALWKFSPKNEKRQMEWIFSGERLGKLITDDIVLTESENKTRGFPGWHIECSAMSHKCLGDQFEIHHGGVEHIAVHHTDEIAQSEACFGVHPRVKYRIHHQHLMVNGGKMSKSDGTGYTLKDIQDKGFSGLDLRMFYFQGHYRSFQDFTRQNLENARNTRQNLAKKIAKLELTNDDIIVLEDCIKNFDISSFENSDFDLFFDDFKTPILVEAVNIALNSCVRLKNNFGKSNKYIIVNDDKLFLQSVFFLDKNILKLNLFDIESKANIEIPSEITDLANARLEAKKNRDFAKADEIRNQIVFLGYEIKDTKDGFSISKI